jgi:hypothetical protein
MYVYIYIYIYITFYLENRKERDHMVGTRVNGKQYWNEIFPKPPILLLYNMDVSCHRPFLPGTSLEPAVIPTSQASSFTLQYFPYYVWCSKYYYYYYYYYFIYFMRPIHITSLRHRCCCGCCCYYYYYHHHHHHYRNCCKHNCYFCVPLITLGYKIFAPCDYHVLCSHVLFSFFVLIWLFITLFVRRFSFSHFLSFLSDFALLLICRAVFLTGL